MFPKSLRGAQFSNAEPSQAPGALKPDEAQLSGNSSEWEVRKQFATEFPTSVCDGAPGQTPRYEHTIFPGQLLWSGSDHSADILNAP